MLLAFSTHALLKYISSNPGASSNNPITLDNATVIIVLYHGRPDSTNPRTHTQNHIQAQRRVYVSTLTAYQEKRNSWELSASLLSQKADSLQTLRVSFLKDPRDALCTYSKSARTVFLKTLTRPRRCTGPSPLTSCSDSQAPKNTISF